MRRSTWQGPDKTYEKSYSRVQDATGRSWMQSDRISDELYCDQPRKPRKQYLCHLISEFEKCAQQAEDATMLKTDVDAVKRGLEEAQASIEDLKFENQMSTDKLKFITKDLQEIKTNHYKLRDEVSKEFRKTYKRIGAMDKEMDLMKYRQSMANKKHSLDVESLRWELTTTRTHEPGYLSPALKESTYTSENFKTEDECLKDYSI